MKNMKKHTTFYANGCSHTAGGGLCLNLTDKSTKPFVYEKLYGIKKWKNEKEVTYPRRVADYFGLEWVNDAASGSGTTRLIRTTNEYIRKVGINKLKNHIIFLQINNPIIRLEMFCRQIDDYVIINPKWDENMKIEEISVVEYYSTQARKYHPNFFKGKIESEIKFYLENYFDPFVYAKEIASNLINLMSFLELEKIDYFYCYSDQGWIPKDYREFFEKEEVKNRNMIIDGCEDVSQFAQKHNLTVNSETEGEHGDFHAGYFGNLKYGELLAKAIEEKLNKKLI